MGVKFYKLRVLFLTKIVRFFALLLAAEVPPAVSVSAIIRNKNKFLALKLTYFDGYALPGGHVQKGESLENALKREVREETGLKVKSLTYFNSYPTMFYKYPSLCASYIAETSGIIRPSSEGALHWLSGEQLLKVLFYEDNKEAIRDFIKK
jgi:NADH pyrophosphatase NudC (nudix superfamily)